MSYDEIYAQAINNGATPRFADMLASRQAPGAQTDREFFAKHGTLDQQMKSAELLESTVRGARANGYNPSPNDVYLSQLARYPNDPEAFVPPSGGRNHVKRLLEKRGWGCEGLVNVKPAQNVPEPKQVPLAPDVIRDLACAKVRKNPDLKRKTKAELTSMVIAEHGPKS
jgi:hypothetical protein